MHAKQASPPLSTSVSNQHSGVYVCVCTCVCMCARVSSLDTENCGRAPSFNSPLPYPRQIVPESFNPSFHSNHHSASGPKLFGFMYFVPICEEGHIYLIVTTHAGKTPNAKRRSGRLPLAAFTSTPAF